MADILSLFLGAIRFDDCNQAEALLLANPAIMHTGDVGFQLLCFACEENRLEIVELLIKAGANIQQANGFGQTPLHFAACHEDAKIVAVLLRAGANIHARSNNLNQPLHIAAEHDNSKAALLLLDHGAEIDERGEFRWTPLHFAASSASPNVAQILVLRGADPNLLDDKGYTPLYLSLWELPPRSNAVLGLLIKGGAMLDIHSIIALGQTQIVSALLFGNTGAIAKNTNADDFLTAAVRTNKSELVELLLRAGANPNAYKYDPLPLHEAISNRPSNSPAPLVELLLRYGADPTLKFSPEGQSPFEIASMNQDRELLRLFAATAETPDE